MILGMGAFQNWGALAEWNSVLGTFRRMSPCGDIFGRDLACLCRQTSGRRPPALISIGRFWRTMYFCPQIGTHPLGMVQIIHTGIFIIPGGQRLAKARQTSRVAKKLFLTFDV